MAPVTLPRDAAAAVRPAGFHGRARTLFGIHVVNVFFTLLTLGLYYPWARVRVRQYLVAQTEFEEDRFAYHGSGREVFVGFLKAALLFGIPFFALQTGPELLDLGDAATMLASLASYAVLLLVLPMARVGARRYRLGRTSWRGTRFAFRGQVGQFVGLYVGGWLLTLVTLGLAYPRFIVRNEAYLVGHSYFGTARFEFDGRARDLLVDFLYAMLLTLPTLGLVWFWFTARKRRYFWEHTTLGPVRFRSTLTGATLLGLKLGNLLLVAATLGLAWPLAAVRNARSACRHLTVEGDLDLAAIRGVPADGSATGEGLLGFLETDLDLG